MPKCYRCGLEVDPRDPNVRRTVDWEQWTRHSDFRRTPKVCWEHITCPARPTASQPADTVETNRDDV
jgi:hypothetical protein